MNIRRTAFFMLDRGNYTVKQQLEEIEKANSDDAFAKKLHEECIKNLIKHAKANIPFYKNIKAESFEDFPVVSKVMMKDDMKSFRSTSGFSTFKERHTSGSTGIPFSIAQDERKAKRVQAEVVYYREQTGDELGTKFINLITPSRLDNITKLSMLKQNVVYFDVTKMDSKVMEELHRLLVNDKAIKYMMGYASALEKIANYFEEKNYKDAYSLIAIVSSSEILTSTTEEKLNRIFKCKVYDRYSNEDNGFIAQSDGESRDFIVNRASFYIEIMKMDEDKPAAENELGRIIITDYYNYAQPFIRYDTGDLGAYAYKTINGCERFVLTKVAGRISDVVYDEQDRPISTFAIGCGLEMFSKIKQYQLIQEDAKKFNLNIIDPEQHYEKKEYENALKDILGNSISVNVEYLDTLPTLSSGKFRRVICKYKPNKK